jgi:phosphoglycolate phosphatase
MNKEVVIFDFDGVIANTFETCYEINKLGDPQLTLDEYRQRFTGNINHAKPEREPTREIDFFAEFGKRILDAPLFDGMRDVINKISETHKMVIVSSTITTLIDGYLLHHDLRNKFEDILGNDVAASKVDKLNTVLNRYNLTISEAVLITDTVGDITEAKEVGLPTIAVTWGYQPMAMLEQVEPNALVENPISIPNAITTIFGYKIFRT